MEAASDPVAAVEEAAVEAAETGLDEAKGAVEGKVRHASGAGVRSEPTSGGGGRGVF